MLYSLWRSGFLETHCTGTSYVAAGGALEMQDRTMTDKTAGLDTAGLEKT